MRCKSPLHSTRIVANSLFLCRWSRRAPQQGPRPQGHRGNLNMNATRGGIQQQSYNNRPQQNPWLKQGNAPAPSVPNPQVQSNKTNAPPSNPSPSTNANASNASVTARPPPVNGFNRKEVEEFLQQSTYTPAHTQDRLCFPP